MLSNTLGQSVKTIVDGVEQEVGKHNVDIDGAGLSEGVYLCLLKVGNETCNKKFVVIK